MLEDVLIQVTQDSAQSTRFVGDTSPFVDVRPDAYYTTLRAPCFKEYYAATR